VVIVTDEGREVNPDCTYRCAYCRSCLGCLKKFYPPEGESIEDWEFRDFFNCPDSPDGNHHVVEEPERN
jgi:hypothetical protein